MAFAWTCFLGGWLLAAEEKPPPRAEPSPQAPLGQVLAWTDRRDKPCWYRLPRKLDARKPPALIFMLHGTGLKWGWAFWYYPIAAGSFRADDVVVAPEGMSPDQAGNFNFIQGPADGDHLAELIADFKARLPIGKVYIYGHSQGAFFAYWFAGEHPELIDGIVAHAGNVLDVKHTPLSRAKVAIGILHGRADAVVPVDCAIRTEKIYRDQKYRNVKLQVVEGLTEQSGHWPLPRQVGEMLAWLDSVTADTPELSLATALYALGKDPPDLAATAEATARAGALLKTWKGKDRASLAERQEALRKLLDEAAREHGAAIEAGSKAGKGEAPYGAWASHFLHAQRALEGLPAWQKAAPGTIKRAAGHEKVVARAMALLDQGGTKSMGEVLKALEGGFLSRHHDELMNSARTRAVSRDAKPEDLKKLDALSASRREGWSEGLKASLDIDRKLARSFCEAHAAWFAEDGGEQPAGGPAK
jgi:predicted esterase